MDQDSSLPPSDPTRDGISPLEVAPTDISSTAAASSAVSNEPSELVLGYATAPHTNANNDNDPNTGVVDSETALLLETAAHAAKHQSTLDTSNHLVFGQTANPPNSHLEAEVEDELAPSMTKATEDAVALAAMQEAAAIVMEAQQEHTIPGKRKHGDGESDGKPAKRVVPARISWNERLKQLAEYKAEHGSLLIPIRYKLNPSLGKFVHNTREQYKLFHKQTPEGYKKKCSLTPERIQQLDALGFVWSTERSKQQHEDWQARLQQLKEFKDKHGHCLVPHGYLQDPSFAEWIHRQRTSYNNLIKGNSKKPANPKAEERFRQLKELGFNFTVHSDKWMDHWQQLKHYKEKHGDCQVPTHYAENQKLGRWVHTQRHQRRLQTKGKKSCMTKQRIDLLDQLGFSWEVRPSLERPRATWQQRFEELQAFYAQHGHFRVDAINMPQLNGWCHEQRQRLKLLDRNQGKDTTKRMSPERVQALQALGFTKDIYLDALGGGRKGSTASLTMLASSSTTTTETPSQNSTPAPNTTNAQPTNSTMA